MPIINSYVNIDSVEREAKKDYIDRHSPFISVAQTAKAGEKLPVNIRLGQSYEHPDDPDHYIAEIKLFDGETLLASATLLTGINGGQGNKGHAEVTFFIVPHKKLKLTALSYCTKHGLWQSQPVEVDVVA
ncbi:MAG: dethiobiotin synthase [Helicobacteraceae bacterium]|jgi:superoxide reductase|nr:dethiobiotin synthase [Helicobacteraceae bacterium]